MRISSSLAWARKAHTSCGTAPVNSVPKSDKDVKRFIDPSSEGMGPHTPQLLDRFNSAFTDIHFDLTHVFAEGNYVCVRYYVDATHIGDFFGVPPTNKKITTSGMAVYELENGKIKVSFAETDFLGVLTQIK